jgi:hypothetical protein
MLVQIPPRQRLTLPLVGPPREPTNAGIPVRSEDACDRNPGPSQTEIFMTTIVLYLGKRTKQAPARRHHAIVGAATAAVLRGSVLFGVPPMVSTLRELR